MAAGLNSFTWILQRVQDTMVMREMEVVAERLGEDDIGWQTARRLNALSMYAQRAPSIPHPSPAPNPSAHASPAREKGAKAKHGGPERGAPQDRAPPSGHRSGGGSGGGPAAPGPATVLKMGQNGEVERHAGPGVASEIELAPSSAGVQGGNAAPPV